jgi:hypothetical protein
MSYVALATTTLGSAASTVTFSSIPATYKDLVVIVVGSPADTSYSEIGMRLNSSTLTCSFVRMNANGSSTSSGGNSSATYLSVASAYGTGPSTSSRFNLLCNIMDYSATDKHKTVLSRSNVPDAGLEANASRWPSTDAVNSVSVFTTVGAGFATGTTISLYGVA